MSDMMTFPATVGEFMEQYKIVDDEKVYTNGADLVPIFRMMQWFEHVSATDTISRQAAIEAVNSLTYPSSLIDVKRKLIELPPTQPEPCEDAVSKETILKFLDDWMSALDENCHNQSVSDLKIIKRDFENLPSVTPKQPEQDWIPASEGMPEEREWIGTKRFGTTISDEVYVTFETPKGERFCKHIRFQNGKLNSADQHTIDTIYKGSKPIAWIPLPKPWEGGAE